MRSHGGQLEAGRLHGRWFLPAPQLLGSPASKVKIHPAPCEAVKVRGLREFERACGCARSCLTSGRARS